MKELNYEEKLQLILKVICEHDYIVISHDELKAKISHKIPGETNNLTDDLQKLGYIITNSTTKNGKYIMGFSPLEKGKDFNSSGGFKRRILEKNLKAIGSIIIFVVTVWTFIITLRGCYKEEDRLKQPLQKDSLNRDRAESFHKSASSTID